MSKFIEAMDAFVRLVLLTVLTTGAMQFSGVARSSRTVSAYPQYRPSVEFPDSIKEGLLPIDGHDLHRRAADLHTDNKTATIIDDIFNIPIATLNAVNTLVQNSRPAIQRLRENAQKRFEQAQHVYAAQNRLPPRRHRKKHRQFGQPRTIDATSEKKTESTSVSTTTTKKVVITDTSM